VKSPCSGRSVRSMARLEVAGDRVEVVLSQLERLGALRGDVSVAVEDVADVCVSEAPFGRLRGLRAPGTGVPGVLALGTWRYRGGKDFVAVRRGRPAVILDVRPGGEFRRLIVSVDDAVRTAAGIRAAVSAVSLESGVSAVPGGPATPDTTGWTSDIKG
jgi:hypothetical protein